MKAPRCAPGTDSEPRLDVSSIALLLVGGAELDTAGPFLELDAMLVVMVSFWLEPD